MAMLGEQFMVGEEICGAVVSIRFQVSILHVDLRRTQIISNTDNGTNRPVSFLRIGRHNMRME